VPVDTYRPKEASASDVADIRVTVEVLVQELSQVLPVDADVFNKILFLHDLLDFKRGSTANRVTLVGVSVGEGTGRIRFRIERWTLYDLTRFRSSTHPPHGG
jgi:hypothetical protein